MKNGNKKKCRGDASRSCLGICLSKYIKYKKRRIKKSILLVETIQKVMADWAFSGHPEWRGEEKRGEGGFEGWLVCMAEWWLMRILTGEPGWLLPLGVCPVPVLGGAATPAHESPGGTGRRSEVVCCPAGLTDGLLSHTGHDTLFCNFLLTNVRLQKYSTKKKWTKQEKKNVFNI